MSLWPDFTFHVHAEKINSELNKLLFNLLFLCIYVLFIYCFSSNKYHNLCIYSRQKHVKIFTFHNRYRNHLWFFSWKMWMIVRKPSKIEVVIGLIIEILCADITEWISINLLKFRISRDRFRSCKRYISRLVHRWQGITYGSGYKAINVLLFLLF